MRGNRGRNKNRSYNPVMMEEGNLQKLKDVKPKNSKLGTIVAGAQTMKLLLPYFWPKYRMDLRIGVIACTFITVIGKVITAVVPMTYQVAIDQLPAVWPLGWILVYNLLRWLSGNVRDIRDSIFQYIANYATRSIALDTFRHLHNLSLGFHLTRNTGALLRTMDRGKNAINTVLTTIMFTFAPTLLEFLLTCGIMFFSYGAWYSLITFLTIVLYLAWTISITEWRTKYRRFMNEADNESTNAALDSCLNYETVKYFNAEQHELQRYDKSMDGYFAMVIKTQWSLAMLNIGQGFIIGAGMLAAMLFASHQVYNGTAKIGELVAVNAYILQLYAPLSYIGTYYRMIVSAFTDMEKLFELLAEEPDVTDIAGASELHIVNGSGEIEFRDVSFTYPRRSNSTATQEQKKLEAEVDNSSPNPVTNVQTLQVPAGKTVAIVGHSGSGMDCVIEQQVTDHTKGKTTIARLLCRFYNPSSGSILIDGQDISTVTQQSLRKVIGVVPQDTVLFNDTIRYNIEYGRVGTESNTDMTVEQAAQEANIHEFVMSTPDQYNTRVGERGLRLSGGEKQRVAIARTFLKDPQILILDEATSSLDSKTEKEIQKSLVHVSKGRTTVIIAHRLSTIVDADEIVVLKKGVIVERGSHRQLLELGKEYASMWELQAQEATERELMNQRKKEESAVNTEQQLS